VALPRYTLCHRPTLCNYTQSPTVLRSQNQDLARILASQAAHSADWLYVMPISSLGLRLIDEGVRVAPFDFSPVRGLTADVLIT